jgi:hypothetical protein
MIYAIQIATTTGRENEKKKISCRKKKPTNMNKIKRKRLIRFQKKKHFFQARHCLGLNGMLMGIKRLQFFQRILSLNCLNDKNVKEHMHVIHP